MSFADQRTTARPIKLAWIALIASAIGFLFVEILGANHWPAMLVIVGIPVAIGLVMGWVGIASDGVTRNRKAVLTIAAIVGIAFISIVAFFVHALLNSTDL